MTAMGWPNGVIAEFYKDDGLVCVVEFVEKNETGSAEFHSLELDFTNDGKVAAAGSKRFVDLVDVAWKLHDAIGS
jgi:hypothetical protein